MLKKIFYSNSIKKTNLIKIMPKNTDLIEIILKKTDLTKIILKDTDLIIKK